ncbi:MAG: dynamin family protein, partial [Cyanobacteria bacterium J06558_2]
MNIDKTLLKQISAKSKKKSNNGIASLIRGIHRSPDIRDWVTLETVAIAPIPVQRLGEWRLISLLSVFQKDKDGTDSYRTPWAAVEWSLDKMEVIRKIDLRQTKVNDPLWKSKVIINQPADLTVSLTAQIRTVRENALFFSLEEFCSNQNRTEEGFIKLAQHYSGLLAKDFYSYYHNLVPESKSWLLVNRPAISLEAFTEQKLDNTSAKINSEEVSIAVTVPHDITQNLPSWFEKCTKIANSLSAENEKLGEEISNLLAKIIKKRLLPGFRLAFIGEFSRGKSHLINRLLEREILPEGALPTTATLTSIIANSQEQMEVRIRDQIDIRPLQKSSWEELVATDQTGSDNEVFAGVRISLDHQWLRSLDIEIIDTPGAGDLNDKRANLVLDVLNQCDAAVLVISATSPFSITESAFLEQEVIGRHVPRLMVAVSKLDVIPSEEKKQVMENIVRRIAQVSKNISILPTYPIAESKSEAEILTDLTTQIESLVAQGDRKIWRSRQICEQLIDWLVELIETAQDAISTIQMNAEERKNLLRQAELEIEKAELNWNNIQIELDKRRLEFTKKIQYKINANKEELIENLEYEIQRTSDIKTWWERDLPFRLRRELTILSRKYESFLLQFLAQDVEWLEQEHKKLFKTTLNPKTIKSSSNTEIDFFLEDREITDVQKYRLLTRIGSSAAIILGSVLGGPIGIAASTGLFIVSEEYLKKELNTEREALLEEIKRIVESSIDKYCYQISDRLRQIYQEIISELKTEQSEWKNIKQSTLKTVFQDDTFSEQKYNNVIKESLLTKES